MSTEEQHQPSLAQKRVAVLGTLLDVTTYAQLAEDCRRAATQPGTLTIEFANTQVVTMRRTDPAFQNTSVVFDRFVPDGMPLVWCMNRHGAALSDRVYGPTFFRYLMEQNNGLRHYLLGGSERTGTLLRSVVQHGNSKVSIVGSYHGICSADGTLEDASVIDEINRLSPDCIWVGLGTPKQQAWVSRYRAQIKRGVILSVGFAFDVNAGTKKDAPMWMQRRGLTWLFRLVTEPRRLGPRYLRYNTLFVWLFLRESFRKSPSVREQR